MQPMDAHFELDMHAFGTIDREMIDDQCPALAIFVDQQ
jgi:hypothetical protein